MGYEVIRLSHEQPLQNWNGLVKKTRKKSLSHCCSWSSTAHRMFIERQGASRGDEEFGLRTELARVWWWWGYVCRPVLMASPKGKLSICKFKEGDGILADIPHHLENNSHGRTSMNRTRGGKWGIIMGSTLNTALDFQKFELLNKSWTHRKLFHGIPLCWHLTTIIPTSKPRRWHQNITAN